MTHNNEKKIERAVKHAQWLREQEARAEALPIIESFNAKLEAGRDLFFMPTIRAALTPSQIAEAQKLAIEWKRIQLSYWFIKPRRRRARDYESKSTLTPEVPVGIPLEL